MYRIFYAERDTTLYEKYPSQNTGIDQILELTKIASGSKLNGIVQTNQYNSRILIDFGSQLTTLQTEIAAGRIPEIDPTHEDSSSIYLNIRAADASDLLHSYELKAYPVSESWANGNGNYSDVPITKNGASWKYRTQDQENAWDSSNAFTNLHQSQAGDEYAGAEPGGGTWITGSTYEASQSFENETPDIRMDVSDIIKNWTDATLTNNGFIVKHTEANERNNEIVGSIKFFGRESHTIFTPRLEVAWKGVNKDTGLYADARYLTLNEIGSDAYVPYFKNIKSEYRTSEITKFRVGVRPEFPTKTYQTSSFYLAGHRLPTSSYYSIKDSVTNETIIPYDTKGTQIDGDVNGSFIKLRMDSFMPERYYKICLKIERSGSTEIQTFDDFYFKVKN